MNETPDRGAAGRPEKVRGGRVEMAGGVLLLLAPTIVAMATGLWVLTAIPVGVLFGFLLQKGDLCGASAISEVILFRDRRKLFGLWVAIVTSMVAFALLDLLGLVTTSPKPLLWLSMGAGGVVFGVGTVLAGGCVSGCLYKTGTGNLNSMAALVAIPVGVGMVEAGPLSGLVRWLNAQVVKNGDGSAVTFASLLGLPAWVVALLVAVATLAAVLLRRRHLRSKGGPARGSAGGSYLRRSWRPWQAGIAIGLVGAVAWLSSAASGRNYPLGVTHGPYHAAVLAMEESPQYVWKRPGAAPAAASPAEGGVPAPAPVRSEPPAKTAGPKVVWWLVALVASLVLGSFIGARLSGQAKLLPRPPEQTVVAFLGGLLIGLGAGAAKGCVIGNILSGIGLLSVGTAVFAVTTVLANWATTYVYLMGGALGPSRRGGD